MEGSGKDPFLVDNSHKVYMLTQSGEEKTDETSLFVETEKVGIANDSKKLFKSFTIEAGAVAYEKYPGRILRRAYSNTCAELDWKWRYARLIARMRKDSIGAMMSLFENTLNEWELVTYIGDNSEKEQLAEALRDWTDAVRTEFEVGGLTKDLGNEDDLLEEIDRHKVWLEETEDGMECNREHPKEKFDDQDNDAPSRVLAFSTTPEMDNDEVALFHEHSLRGIPDNARILGYGTLIQGELIQSFSGTTVRPTCLGTNVKPESKWRYWRPIGAVYGVECLSFEKFALRDRHLRAATSQDSAGGQWLYGVVKTLQDEEIYHELTEDPALTDRQEEGTAEEENATYRVLQVQTHKRESESVLAYFVETGASGVEDLCETVCDGFLIKARVKPFGDRSVSLLMSTEAGPLGPEWNFLTTVGRVMYDHRSPGLPASFRRAVRTFEPQPWEGSNISTTARCMQDLLRRLALSSVLMSMEADEGKLLRRRESKE